MVTDASTNQKSATLRTEAARIVHRGTDDRTRTVLAELLAHDIFDGRSHCEPDQTYERLRFLNERLPRLREDLPRLLALIESLAPVAPPVCFAALVHYLLGVACVVELGSECDLADDLADLDAMRAVGVFVTTEIGRGGSHVRPETEATYDPERNEFLLNSPTAGATKLMPNVALPGLPKVGVVTARLIVTGVDRGVFGFLVPLRDEYGPCAGVRIDALPDMPAMRLDHALVSFDRVRVPFRHWLRDGATIGPEESWDDPIGGGDARLVRTMRVGTNVWAAQAAACASVCRAAVATAIKFAFRRPTAAVIAPGLPVIRYRTQQRALFEALATTYAITCLANEIKTAKAKVATSETAVTWAPWATVNRTSAVAKAIAAIAAGRIIRECRERCGALGLLSTNRLTDHEGLAHAFYAAGGDSLLILLDAARTLTTDVEPGGGTAAHLSLTDPGLWQTAFRVRESVLAAELAEVVKREGDVFEVWNDRLDLAKELGLAHGARLSLDSFLDAVTAVPEPVTRDPLLSLCGVYALSEIARHSGWFLCEQVLSREQVRRIPLLLNEYCESLVPHAGALVDAFDLPASAGNAPIAADDYVAALFAQARERSLRDVAG